MNRASQKLFPRACLAGDENVHVARRNLLREREEFLHGGRRSDQLVELSSIAGSRAQALQLFLCGVEFVSALQNQPELNHVGRVHHAIVGAVLHHSHEQRTILSVAKRDHRRMDGNLADLVHQTQAGFVVALSPGMPKIEQHHIAPIAMLVEAAQLEFVASARGKAGAQGASDDFR